MSACVAFPARAYVLVLLDFVISQSSVRYLAHPDRCSLVVTEAFSGAVTEDYRYHYD